MYPNSISRKIKGFTLIEVIIVIVVIALLAGIMFTGYGSYKKDAVITQIKSDLSSARVAMENYRNFNNYYPTSIPSTLDTSSSVTMSGGSADGKAYCIDEYINDNPSIKYYLSSSDPNPGEGGCIAVTSIGSIAGAAILGSTLTAGALSPIDASVTYQWQSSAAVDGVYVDIFGAENSTYVLTTNEVGKYIKVRASAAGSYIGSVTSIASSLILNSDWIAVNGKAWAKYNLNIGTTIHSTISQTNNLITEKHCSANLEANCTTYGGLYQWDEAMQYVITAGAQGICPAGSHIPTSSEWSALVAFLGGTGVAGGNLKSGGSSGMNVPLSGLRYTSGGFAYLSTHAFMWSSSESGINAWDIILFSSDNSTSQNTNEKGRGFAVRCMGN